MTRRLSVVLALTLALAGCGDDGDPGPVDSGALDSGPTIRDSSVEDAAPTPTDASLDGGETDASTVDAGETDAGTVDSGTVDAGTVDAGPSCLPRLPREHRPVAHTCDDVRDPGLSGLPEGWECQSDADCTDGRNGRCTNSGRIIGCTYDVCFTDDDCGADSICVCGSGLEANRCMPANCNTDADCESGACSPTFGSCGSYSGVVAYQCHTCEDECVDNGDCELGYCAFDWSLGHWACSTSECAG